MVLRADTVPIACMEFSSDARRRQCLLQAVTKRAGPVQQLNGGLSGMFTHARKTIASVPSHGAAPRYRKASIMSVDPLYHVTCRSPALVPGQGTFSTAALVK